MAATPVACVSHDKNGDLLVDLVKASVATQKCVAKCEKARSEMEPAQDQAPGQLIHTVNFDQQMNAFPEGLTDLLQIHLANLKETLAATCEEAEKSLFGYHLVNTSSSWRHNLTSESTFESIKKTAAQTLAKIPGGVASKMIASVEKAGLFERKILSLSELST